MISSNLNSNTTYITETNTISHFDLKRKLKKGKNAEVFKMLKGWYTALLLNMGPVEAEKVEVKDKYVP